MSRRGPKMSFNLPITTPKMPILKKAVDEAPEIAALDQPNSSISGLKKTPKEI
jgi:hypothetical protein